MTFRAVSVHAFRGTIGVVTTVASASAGEIVRQDSWNVGTYLDGRCEACFRDGNGAEPQSWNTGVFGGLAGGDFRLQAGLRYVRMGPRRSQWVQRDAEVESMWSATVYFDPGRFAIGLGMHRAHQFIKPFFIIEGTTPSVALRIGRPDALSAYASFGDFGDARESSGQFNMGLMYARPEVGAIWAGVAGDITPVAANELGVEVRALGDFRIGLRVAADLPNATDYMFAGMFVGWESTLPLARELLDP